MEIYISWHDIGIPFAFEKIYEGYIDVMPPHDEIFGTAYRFAIGPINFWWEKHER